MMTSGDRQTELRRMEEACRQTRHQLDMIDRQIIRKNDGIDPVAFVASVRLSSRQAAGPGGFPFPLPLPSCGNHR